MSLRCFSWDPLDLSLLLPPYRRVQRRQRRRLLYASRIGSWFHGHPSSTKRSSLSRSMSCYQSSLIRTYALFSLWTAIASCSIGKIHIQIVSTISRRRRMCGASRKGIAQCLTSSFYAYTSFI